MKKNVFAIVLAITFAITGLTGCSKEADYTESSNESVSEIQEDQNSISGIELAEVLPIEMSVDYGQGPITMYGYQCLQSDKERQVYMEIDEHVGERVPTAFSTHGISDINRISQIIDIYTLDHPEVFWIDEEINVKACDSGVSECILRYNCEGEELEERIGEFEETMEMILLSVPDDANAFEKELVINDYLIDLCEYDHEAPNDDLYVARNEIYSYGALVDHLANCEGYTKAAKVLLDRVGINNVPVGGKSDGIPHIWNAVEIDGNWYILDVTNNDYSSDSTSNEFWHHIYFNISVEKNSIIDSIDGIYGDEVDKKSVLHNLYIPECTATAENFFVKTCDVLNTSDYQNIVQKVADAAKAGEDHYAFIVDENSDYEDFRNWLYDKEKFRDLLWSVNEINGYNPEIEENEWPDYFKPYRVIWINLKLVDNN